MHCEECKGEYQMHTEVSELKNSEYFLKECNNLGQGSVASVSTPLLGVKDPKFPHSWQKFTSSVTTCYDMTILAGKRLLPLQSFIRKEDRVR
ncbi:hypothetical protein J6590_088931, partial [Homalodisca vitripennis]